MGKHRAYKGDKGYIRYERFSRTLRTALYLAIPLIAFLAAFLYFGTRENIITIVAMVGLIPACMSIVSVVMMYTVRPMPEDEYLKILPHTDGFTMAYELYLTNYDKNTLLDAAALCGDTVVGLATYKAPERKESERHMENVFRTEGFKADVTVFHDVNKFIERLDTLRPHMEDRRNAVSRRNDERFPEETYEEQLLHILLRVSA